MPAESAFVENPFIKKDRIEQRAYQVNLAENVLKGGNSLVVAPTALGKTIVAVLVAAAVLEREKDKKILFLAPTKPLCQQHQNTMQELMQLEKEQIILLTGSIAVKKRAKQWEQALIVTATPQTIENDVRNARISMQNVSLIIFDEAHRAVGDYAYVYIAKKFIQQNQKALILGLTASPGAEQEHINEVCSSLFIKNIEIKSLGDEDVKPYTHEIKIEWRTVELPLQFKEIKGMLQQFMQKQIAVLNKFGLSRAKSPAGFNQKRLIEMQVKIRQGIKRYGFRQPSLFAAATAVAALMKANHASMLLETQGIAALNSFLERTVEKSNEPKASRALRQFLASTEIRQAMDLTKQLNEKGVRHPKQHVLEELLKQQFELFPESRVIVFNHYRDSIKRLAEELNKVPGIRAERFVGQATKGKDIGMSQKDQAEKIQQLRSGEINCIVASSVHPDEFIIIRNDAENKIEIKKIGEFVDSFIPNEHSKSETAKITGYSVLSFDGTKTDFLPMTQVHKHQRQSEIVETVFSSGFRAQVTTDHSFFTFDESSNLVPAPPRQNMFAKICLSAPNIQEQKKLDLAKELYQKLPLEFREKVFCSISELNQPKMRIVSSDRKFLQSIAKESKHLARISNDAGLDTKTTQIVCERLKAEARVSTMRKGKYCFVSIRPGGEEYLSFLNWLFKNCSYYKGKYRVSLEDVAKSNIKL
ncbi:MAG: DEAD/DEAH box helicase, partial [Candidatus Diapherotrites archaeon]|nr:DEAD/DEAH box helicase [Candidatus Diapherotrites archaeon]